MRCHISEGKRMTLNEIKQKAESTAVGVELDWERLENEKDANYLVERLQMWRQLIPDLESLYTKVSSGKSVLLPDSDTSLSYAATEKYTAMIAEELHAAYVMQSVYDKYEKVNSIIQLSRSV
jgi:hypothetical protein